MNHKLLVIAMVPLLVGFAGAVAFSSYSGTITKTVTVTTGTVKVYESVYCVGGYIQGTAALKWSIGGKIPSTLLLDGGKGKAPSGCPIQKEYPCWGWCDPPSQGYLGAAEFLGPGVDSNTFAISVGLLVPGDWVEFELVDSVSPFSTVGASLGISQGLSPAGSIPASPSGIWTYLPDKVTIPCYTTYILPNLPTGDLYTATHSGLEYCTSGALAGSPLSPVGLNPGQEAISYLLVGFDNNPGTPPYAEMGDSGTLTITTTATSVP